jgi:hypothetical protein
VTAPNITINSPSGDQGVQAIPYNVTLNATVADTNLANCSYNSTFNASLTVYTCNTNTIITIPTSGTQTIYVYVNDSLGNTNMSSTTITLFVAVNSVSYTTPIFETSWDQILLNATYDNSTYPSAVGYLYYQDVAGVYTQHLAIKYTDGVNQMFNATNVAPNVAGSSENRSFYWSIYLNAGTTANTTTYNQTINQLNGLSFNSTCPSGQNTSYCFNFADEINMSVINNMDVFYNFQISLGAGTKIFNGSTIGVNSSCLCINSSLSPTYQIQYGEVQYSNTALTYNTRRFYLYNGTVLSSTLQNNTLYGLLAAYATPFQFTVTDNNLVPYNGYYLSQLRWHPEINSYIPVEMSYLDNKGQGILQLQQLTPSYRYSINYPNGSLLELFTARQMICTTAPCTYGLFVSVGATEYDSWYGIQSSLTYNNNTDIITYTWNDPSMLTKSMNLTVTKEGGAVSYNICSVSGAGYIGALTCNVSGYTGQIFAKAYRTASPQKTVTSDSWTLGVNTFMATDNGKTVSLFFGFILVGLIGLIGVFAPVLALILAVVAMIPLIFLGGINYIIFIGFGILAFIVYHAVKRSS